MNIEWIIPCRYVEVHDNLGTLIGAGVDTYWVQELPAPISVLLAVRLVGVADEFTPDDLHSTATRVKAPRGETMTEATGEFAIAADSAQPDYLSGVTLPMVVQFEATEEGTYAIEFDVDDASKSLPIHVVHGLPPGVEAPPGEA